MKKNQKVAAKHKKKTQIFIESLIFFNVKLSVDDIVGHRGMIDKLIFLVPYFNF